jgi:hypothetical protein
MNIPYLLKILDTNKVSELVSNIDLPPLDINLAIWDAVAAGQIDVDEKKDKIKALTEPEASFNADLSNKLIRTIQHYCSRELNITRGRLNAAIKDPLTEKGYPWHEYLMALQYLIDSGQVIEEEVTVPKEGDRPYHKFVFLCLPDNPNEEWNRREVNKFIANFAKKK